MRYAETGFDLEIDLSRGSIEKVANDPDLTELTFSFLDDTGAWQDTWDVDTQRRLPEAIRISVGGTINGRAQTFLPLTVPLRVGTEPQQ